MIKPFFITGEDNVASCVFSNEGNAAKVPEESIAVASKSKGNMVTPFIVLDREPVLNKDQGGVNAAPQTTFGTPKMLALPATQITYIAADSESNSTETLDFSGELGQHLVRFDCDDSGNVDRLVFAYPGIVQYCSEDDKFYIWNGRFWEKDVSLRIINMAERVMIAFRNYVKGHKMELGESLFRFSCGCCNEGRLKAMTGDMLKSRVPISRDKFDTFPYLLNVANGIVDLRTSQLYGHNASTLLTKITAAGYDPMRGADAFLQSTFYSFIRSICNYDQEQMRFLQTVFGYAVTGETREQVFFILYGNGSNGKSVLLEAICAAVGDISWHLPVKNLVGASEGKGGGRANPDIVGASTARLVVSSEPENGDFFNEATVKLLTGESVLTTRQVYKESFEFWPKFKIFIDANHLPRIRGRDYGIMRRIKVIPFNVTFSGKNVDKNLPQKLRQPAEKAAIISWLIEGARNYYQHGLVDPSAVARATTEYCRTADTVGTFIAERLIQCQGSQIPASSMYEEYCNFCFSIKVEPETETQFGLITRSKGLQKKRRNSGVFYVNVSIIE